MSVALDIVRTYRVPHTVVSRRASGTPSEPRALVILMAGCLLMFVAQWPLAARAAHVDPTIPLQARLGGALMGWLFIAPLFFYVLAFVARLVAAVLGGKGTAYQARIALFWAVLASAPLWLLTGLTGGFIGGGPAFTGTGLLATLAFFVIWGAGSLAIERQDPETA